MSMHYENGQESALYKLGFMGMSPEQLKHIALRAAGGAAAGAGVGAVAGGEGNRVSGALTGGALGGLTAGGLSAGSKGLQNLATRQLADPAASGMSPETLNAVRQLLQNSQQSLKGGVGGAMGGGAIAGALPGMLGGRMQRDE